MKQVQVGTSTEKSDNSNRKFSNNSNRKQREW